jgi:hypothetical protein
MLCDINFVRQSLELNLFFLRIAKEHSIFLEMAFTPKDRSLAEQADIFKQEFTALLFQAINLSDGIVDCDVVLPGEFVTDITIEAEIATENLTGITINTDITKAELALRCGMTPSNIPVLVKQVTALNHRAIELTNALIKYKAKLLHDVLSCTLFTSNYPLLIDHILREAKLYINMLVKLQCRIAVDISKEIIEQEIFWNRIMAEHAKFIRGLLDPTEVQLFNSANNFGNEFDELTAEALALCKEIHDLREITNKSLEATKAIRDFKRQGTEGLLACKIKAIVVPLLGDHVLREANHYLRLLEVYKRHDNANP